jgi:ABC-type uncharacterized transport system permease subunit
MSQRTFAQLLCLFIGLTDMVLSYVFEVPGLTYGLVDQGILMLGAYTGFEVDPYVTKWFKNARPGLGILLGAAIGNMVSDFLGAVCDPGMHDSIIGITNGCFIPLFAIPLVESFVTRNKRR